MNDVYPRTRLEEDSTRTYRITADGMRDVFVLMPAARAPLVVVPATDSQPERVFDLKDVRTFTHDWLDDDGLDEDDPDILLRSSDDMDTVLIRDVVEHMVAIDHYPSDSDTPRLLVWTEHEHDDHEPTAIPL